MLDTKRNTVIDALCQGTKPQEQLCFENTSTESCCHKLTISANFLRLNAIYIMPGNRRNTVIDASLRTALVLCQKGSVIPHALFNHMVFIYENQPTLSIVHCSLSIDVW